MGVSFVQEVTVVLWLHGGDGPMDIQYELAFKPEDEENRKIFVEGIESILGNFSGPAGSSTLYYAQYHIEGFMRFLQQEPRFNRMKYDVHQRDTVIRGRLYRRDPRPKWSIEWSPSKAERANCKAFKRRRRQEKKDSRRRLRKDLGYTINPTSTMSSKYMGLFHEKPPELGPQASLDRSLRRIAAHDRYYSEYGKLSEQERDELWAIFNNPGTPRPKLMDKIRGEPADVIMIDEAHRVRKEP